MANLADKLQVIFSVMNRITFSTYDTFSSHRKTTKEALEYGLGLAEIELKKLHRTKDVLSAKKSLEHAITSLRSADISRTQTSIILSEEHRIMEETFSSESGVITIKRKCLYDEESILYTLSRFMSFIDLNIGYLGDNISLRKIILSLCQQNPPDKDEQIQLIDRIIRNTECHIENAIPIVENALLEGANDYPLILPFAEAAKSIIRILDYRENSLMYKLRLI